MKKKLIPIFLVLVVIQWLVPAQMIFQKENVQTKGTDYKFRTEPIDPYDPFTGKYITLRYRNKPLKVISAIAPKNEEYVFVTFKKDKEGFAEIAEVMDKIPQRTDYLRTTINSLEPVNDSTIITIDYSFNKFYMEESKAPEAESIYGNAGLDSSVKVYALVSLYKGEAVIKNVYVNDTTISNIITRNRQLRTD